jgi:hypothetical protein
MTRATSLGPIGNRRPQNGSPTLPKPTVVAAKLGTRDLKCVDPVLITGGISTVSGTGKVRIRAKSSARDHGSRKTMSASHLLALMLIFGFSVSVARNWRKILMALCVLVMTAVCFGICVIGTLHSECDRVQPRACGIEIAADTSS